jgi:hypothetical protein
MKLPVYSCLVLFLLLAGCTSVPYVTQQAIPTFDPAQYKTFAILEQPETSTERSDASIYRSARMIMAGSLRGKGLEPAPLEEADIVFQASGAAMPTVDVANYGFFYYNYGWDWYWQPFSYRTTAFSNEERATIVLSAFDNSSKELVWQAGSQLSSRTGGISREEALDALKAMLAEYPGR